MNSRSRIARPVRRALPTIITVSTAAAICAWQLLVAPVVGLANNGDFERVMGYVGFQYPDENRAEKYFSWIVTKFAFGPPGWFRSGLVTSETLVAWLARLISEPFSREGLFDLRVLGAIHAALFVGGLGLLISATRPLAEAARWVAAALLVLFFTDVGYVAPFNSFYSQAASLVFLVLTLGFGAHCLTSKARGAREAVIFFTLAALFVSSKPQEAVQGFLLAAFGLRLFWKEGRRGPRQTGVWGALALAAFSVWYLRSTPPAISEIARYHKVFMELLPNSPSPAQDLADLGLDSTWSSAAGTIAYGPTSPYADPAFRRAFLDRFSYSRLAWFYLSHPDRFASTLRRGGQDALRLRHPRFGNFEHRQGVEAGAKARRFAFWSDIRLIPHPLLWLGPLLAVNLALAVATGRRASPGGRLARHGIVLLVAMATTAFLVCVLSNAHGDLPRHLYVFHALCDLILVIDVTWGVHFLVTGLHVRARETRALRSHRGEPPDTNPTR